MWNALSKQGVPLPYICLLQKLYRGQTAQVRTDADSWKFEICRGTKQGDPLSSLLFNCLLEDIMRQAKTRWKRKRYGIKLGITSASTLTNLRFADDVLLAGRTLHQIQSMLSDIHEIAGAVGLCLHPDKTKILTNVTKKKRGRGAHSRVTVNGMEIEILPAEESVKYLGKLLSSTAAAGLEIDHRIRQAWKAFMARKSELTSNRYGLRSRLRLFDSTVTPTMLYGASSWTLPLDLQHRIHCEWCWALEGA